MPTSWTMPLPMSLEGTRGVTAKPAPGKLTPAVPCAGAPVQVCAYLGREGDNKHSTDRCHWWVIFRADLLTQSLQPGPIGAVGGQSMPAFSLKVRGGGDSADHTPGQS